MCILPVFKWMIIGRSTNKFEKHSQAWASKGGAGEDMAPWILRILTKKFFLVSRGKKQILPLLAPLENFGKIP